jgi:hypothetical protein
MNMVRFAKKITYFSLAVLMFSFTIFFNLQIKSAKAAQTVNLHTTLNSQVEVETPDVGPAGTLTGSPSFVSGKVGNAMDIDANGKYASYDDEGVVSTGGVLNDKGLIEFWYRPHYSRTGGTVSAALTVPPVLE